MSVLRLRRFGKKAIWGYVVGFLAVYNFVFALLALEEFRAIYIVAGYNHASPLAVSCRRILQFHHVPLLLSHL